MATIVPPAARSLEGGGDAVATMEEYVEAKSEKYELERRQEIERTTAATIATGFADSEFAMGEHVIFFPRATSPA